MNRFMLGVAFGGALLYFFDPEHGEARRMRFSNWASQYINSDTMEQARHAGQATIEQARSLTGQVTEQVNQMRSGRRSATSGAPSSNTTRSTAGVQA